jgi:hypothetical protein
MFLQTVPAGGSRSAFEIPLTFPVDVWALYLPGNSTVRF